MTETSSPTPRARRGARAAAVIATFALAAPTLVAQPTRLDTVLTIGQAARLAARQAAPVEEARIRTAEAQSRVVQSRSALLPNASVGSTYNGRSFNTATLGIDFPTGTNPVTGAPNPALFDPNGELVRAPAIYDVRGRLAQSLVDFGATERVRAARASARAFQADEAGQGETAANTAASAYLRALRADGRLQARIADSALAADLLRIAQQQLRAGTGVGLDVTRAASQAASTRAQLLVARNDGDRARLDLVRALQLPLATNVRLADSLGSLPLDDSIPDEAVATTRALERRPDLRTAREQIAAAERGVAAIRAERLPAVSAFVDQGFTGKGLNTLINTYTYGFQLSLPLFDGFRRESRVQEQQLVAREIDVRRRDLELQAGLDVRGALLDLRSAREQVAAAREGLTLAEQEVTQARERFSAGVAGNADVITASLSLNAARNTLVDGLTSYQAARIALARAQGALTELP